MKMNAIKFIQETFRIMLCDIINLYNELIFSRQVLYCTQLKRWAFVLLAVHVMLLYLAGASEVTSRWKTLR